MVLQQASWDNQTYGAQTQHQVHSAGGGGGWGAPAASAPDDDDWDEDDWSDDDSSTVTTEQVSEIEPNHSLSVVTLYNKPKLWFPVSQNTVIVIGTSFASFLMTITLTACLYTFVYSGKSDCLV